MDEPIEEIKKATNPPQSWYKADMPGFIRYWDGSQWTNNYEKIEEDPIQKAPVLGIISLILAVFAAPLGVLIGIISYATSEKGQTNSRLSLAAIIIGCVVFLLWILVTIGSLFSFDSYDPEKDYGYYIGEVSNVDAVEKAATNAFERTYDTSTMDYQIYCYDELEQSYNSTAQCDLVAYNYMTEFYEYIPMVVSYIASTPNELTVTIDIEDEFTPWDYSERTTVETRR